MYYIVKLDIVESELHPYDYRVSVGAGNWYFTDHWHDVLEHSVVQANINGTWANNCFYCSKRAATVLALLLPNVTFVTEQQFDAMQDSVVNLTDYYYRGS